MKEYKNNLEELLRMEKSANRSVQSPTHMVCPEKKKKQQLQDRAESS